MPSSTRIPKPFPTKICLCIALSLSLMASSSLAIDLGRAFKKNNGDASALVPMTTEEALLTAKKLVNDMNDAATGTVTSYQPGREKEPITCNEIMAKSVVLANEEKAVITAEKDAVVRAATLLSEKIDAMGKELSGREEEVVGLERMVIDAEAVHEGEMKSAKDLAERDMEEAAKMLAGAVEHHAGEMKKAAEAAARDMEEAEERLTAAKAEAAAEIQKAADDAEAYVQEANAKVQSEMEKNMISMDALKNSTSARIAKIEEETAEALAAKDAEVARKAAEAEQKILNIQAEGNSKISAAQEYADNRVDSIIRKTDADRMEVLEATQKQIAEVKEEAERTVARMESEMSDKEDEHQKEIGELTALHASQMKQKEEEMESKIKEGKEETNVAIKVGEENVRRTKETMQKSIDGVQAQMEKALAKAEQDILQTQQVMAMSIADVQTAAEQQIAKSAAKYRAEKESNDRLRRELQEKADEADNKERNLSGDIKLLRSSSFKLQDEVSLWKEKHNAQGYCNTTLMREDSGRFVADAWGNTSRGLQSGREALAAAMSARLEFAQNKYADAMVFIEKEVLPKIEKIVGEAREKADALYDEHLAEHVNANLVPVYNEHILPVYTQHVSPVVETAKGEAAVAYDKSQQEVRKARSGAARLVRQSSSSAILAMEEKEIDTMMPEWIMSQLTHSSKDGEWAVDNLSRGLLILMVVLCRGLIKRLIGAVFSLVWFFCPLRLFVGGRRKPVVENDAKQGTKKKATKTVVKKV